MKNCPNIIKVYSFPFKRLKHHSSYDPVLYFLQTHIATKIRLPETLTFWNNRNNSTQRSLSYVTSSCVLYILRIWTLAVQESYAPSTFLLCWLPRWKSFFDCDTLVASLPGFIMVLYTKKPLFITGNVLYRWLDDWSLYRASKDLSDQGVTALRCLLVPKPRFASPNPAPRWLYYSEGRDLTWSRTSSKGTLLYGGFLWCHAEEHSPSISK